MSMTNQEKFVHKNVESGCKHEGLSHDACYDAANKAVIDYRQHKFKNVEQLILNAIKTAKKLNKEEKKNGNVRKN